MRKHRIFGVVIAALIGLGAFTHGSNTSHRTPGAGRAGIQLASATLATGTADAAGSADAADPGNGAGEAPIDETAATDTAAGLDDDLLHQLAGQAVAELTSPFGPETLVSDIRLAVLSK